MIEGLKLTVTGEELANLLARRIESHKRSVSDGSGSWQEPQRSRRTTSRCFQITCARTRRSVTNGARAS